MATEKGARPFDQDLARSQAYAFFKVIGASVQARDSVKLDTLWRNLKKIGIAKCQICERPVKKQMNCGRCKIPVRCREWKCEGFDAADNYWCCSQIHCPKCYQIHVNGND